MHGVESYNLDLYDGPPSSTVSPTAWSKWTGLFGNLIQEVVPLHRQLRVLRDLRARRSASCVSTGRCIQESLLDNGATSMVSADKLIF